jgi:hypothetical protein
MTLELKIQNIEALKDLQAAGNPICLNYGVGVDSTAMLVALWNHGVRPDLILFSDTGGEKPETYQYLDHINAWLAEKNFPQVTVVKYVPVRAPYETLEGKCRANAGMPSLATGGHSCALVFKVDVMDRWIANWGPAKDAWAAGRHVIRLIGYDAGSRDSVRCAKFERLNDDEIEIPADDGTELTKQAIKRAKSRRAQKEAERRRFRFGFPLQMLGIDREQCKQLIKQACLEVPMKSACFFCPASTKKEVVWLRDTHPELYRRAVAMENEALTGRHAQRRKAEGKPITTIGLGRKWTWASLADATAANVDDQEMAWRP